MFSYVSASRLDYNSDYTVASRGPPSMRQPPGAYHNSASSTSRSAGTKSHTSAASPTWLVACAMLILLLVQWSTGAAAYSGDTVDEHPRGSSYVFMAITMKIVGQCATWSHSRRPPNFFSFLTPSSTSYQLQTPSHTQPCSSTTINTSNHNIERNDMSASSR